MKRGRYITQTDKQIMRETWYCRQEGLTKKEKGVNRNRQGEGRRKRVKGQNERSNNWANERETITESEGERMEE